MSLESENNYNTKKEKKKGQATNLWQVTVKYMSTTVLTTRD